MWERRGWRFLPYSYICDESAQTLFEVEDYSFCKTKITNHETGIITVSSPDSKTARTKFFFSDLNSSVNTDSEVPSSKMNAKHISFKIHNMHPLTKKKKKALETDTVIFKEGNYSSGISCVSLAFRFTWYQFCSYNTTPTIWEIAFKNHSCYFKRFCTLFHSSLKMSKCLILSESPRIPTVVFLN